MVTLMKKDSEMQKFIRYYKQVTGDKEVDMHKVAELAATMGWALPVPSDPLALLAKQFSKAARQEIRHDKRTGRPYRVNHAFVPDGKQTTLWVDIDEAPRKHMLKSAVTRREQMVGDALQLTLDLEHWNNSNPAQEPIQLPMDLTDDVLWRLNGEDAA